MADEQFPQSGTPGDQQVPVTLDLSSFPPIYVLTSHLSSQELHEAEDALHALNAPLTYDAKEAKLILGNISTARRAKLELHWLGVHISEDRSTDVDRQPAKKRPRIAHKLLSSGDNASNAQSGSDLSDDSGAHDAPESQTMARLSISQQIEGPSTQVLQHDRTHDSPQLEFPSDELVVARLEWLQRSLSSNKRLPLSTFIVLQGRSQLVTKEAFNEGVQSSLRLDVGATQQLNSQSRKATMETIMERAKRDEHPGKKRFMKRARINEAADKDFVGRTFSSSTQPLRARGFRSTTPRTHLLHETTSEHDESDFESLPPLPEWVLKNQAYSCERATPANQPNEKFLSRLNLIRLARSLTLDEIGVRAYSTSIAAIAAYPYKLRSPREILALPGCDQKIAHLFHDYQTNDGHIQAVADLEADPHIKVLREFHEIWGVGAITARDFHYDKGWNDLDDVIEFGWKTLSRVQQIGLKYYDEFQIKIPRSEVELIATVIEEHARRVTDPGIQTIIVGGYRRGKSESGDVDVILSHPHQDMTLDLVSEVVKSLEKEGWITHTLTLNLTNSKRNQEPLALKGSTLRGHGFDTLDKALVVWRDPHWPSDSTETSANPNTKNPNPHRRVDIIISPWRTVGCAVAGWTSGTTFQRDLRRYIKKVKGWKFDSSGVRDRATGNWIDLESWRNEETRCTDWREAERRVFEGIGLEYREPWERCTW